MDEDDEQTMQMAADIARNRRSVELRKRSTKVSTQDVSSQTHDHHELTKGDHYETLSSRGHKQTTLLCYMSFVLVISNLSQLRLTISLTQHKHYYVILGLLLTSLIIQCIIAISITYFTKREMDLMLNPDEPSYFSKHHNVAILFLSIITLINICVFVLS